MTTTRLVQIRTAAATWEGDLLSGAGTINSVGSGAFSDLPVTWRARTEASEGKTSPEELLAAAHAACFSMALSSRLAKAGSPAEHLAVGATVTFEKQEAGWKVISSALEVRGRVPGMDAATFGALADDAKQNCPISQALKGNVALSVDATLVD
ncbi:MAG TPA: OsmC family peroxiredoxin [Candidatus Limnocylindrales bacterium]|nr:OsmC family peroxiredoxin [Candidatus Limnocylindrales bacterium]